ncbi:MAG: selenide, water dikinase SelD [Saprospiraceae bacterium]
MEPIRLTQYSHGAGCGCKISPKNLDIILKSSFERKPDSHLLVGYDSRDDAAVYDIGNGQAIISTTDFFMPIVDDAFDFGRIAATNAISDVYAMGGKPIMAIAVLGWPINKLPLEVAQQVVDGGREVCKNAGIPLAGGHSIDSPEPIFGLAVTGIIDTKFLKRNDTAKNGDKLYLTKPIGVGIYSTAQKKGLLKTGHEQIMVDTMCTLNKAGALLSKIEGVHAMTDVTGFGLLGHLIEMAKGSNLSAKIYSDKISLLPDVIHYIEAKSFPGGTTRNWESYSHEVSEVSELWKYILADPQTSGGLLISVDPTAIAEVEELLFQNNLQSHSIGEIISKRDKVVTVQ